MVQRLMEFSALGALQVRRIESIELGRLVQGVVRSAALPDHQERDSISVSA